MNLLEWLTYRPWGGQFRELRGLVAYAEPESVEIYREQLPAVFAMPSRPLIAVLLIDYLAVAPWPLVRYGEWTMLLRCVSRDRRGHAETGWFPLVMPVTTWVACTGGRHLGFPKAVCESIELGPAAHDGTDPSCSQEAMLGRGVAGGREELRMAFTPGRDRDEHWLRPLDVAGSLLASTLFTLKPVGVGPRVRRVRFIDATAEPGTWTMTRGMVAISGDHQLLCDGLLPRPRRFPGAVHHFRGSMNLFWEPVERNAARK